MYPFVSYGYSAYYSLQYFLSEQMTLLSNVMIVAIKSTWSGKEGETLRDGLSCSGLSLHEASVSVVFVCSWHPLVWPLCLILINFYLLITLFILFSIHYCLVLFHVLF